MQAPGRIGKTSYAWDDNDERWTWVVVLGVLVSCAAATDFVLLARSDNNDALDQVKECATQSLEAAASQPPSTLAPRRTLGVFSVREKERERERERDSTRESPTS